MNDNSFISSPNANEILTEIFPRSRNATMIGVNARIREREREKKKHSFCFIVYGQPASIEANFVMNNKREVIAQRGREGSIEILRLTFHANARPRVCTHCVHEGVGILSRFIPRPISRVSSPPPPL